MERHKLAIDSLANMIWRFAERTGAQIINFIVAIVLARVVGPDIYGTVAIITVFITILYTFVDGGFGNALIQKKDADELDFSTVFYFNIVTCIVLYVFLFVAAPYIARIYGNQELTELIRVLGITLLISGIKNTQQAYVAKNMLFKKFFWSTLIGTIGAGLLGITMAYNGKGAWALVCSHLFNSVVDMIVLWFTVGWRPIKSFSLKRLKRLFSYGSRILGANCLQTIYSNIYDLVIGKTYSSAELAYFNKGKAFPMFVVNNVDDAITSILFPVMSERQNDICRVRILTKRAIKTNFFIMTPILLLLAVVAEPLVKVLLTEVWLDCVPFLIVFVLIQIGRPLATSNLEAVKALGRSDLFLRLEVIKDLCGISIFFITVRESVFEIALGLLINSVICQIINSWPSKKLIQYGLAEQLSDVLPIICLAVISGGISYTMKYFILNDYALIIMQIICFMSVYLGLSELTNLEAFAYTKDVVCSLFESKIKEV